MDPPTCTVDCKLVRSTRAVATDARRDDDGLVVVPAPNASATPPATAPATNALASAATNTIRFVLNSATAGSADDRANSAVSAGPAGRAVPARRFDRTARRGTADARHAGRGGTYLRCVLERRAVRVQVAAGIDP